MRAAIFMLLLAAPASFADDSIRLSARIDARIAEKWTGKVEPAPQADDAEFFRRLSLDLTGRVPSLAAVRDFLDDDRPDKRRLWTDDLLASPESATHFATYWRAVLLAQAN